MEEVDDAYERGQERQAERTGRVQQEEDRARYLRPAHHRRGKQMFPEIIAMLGSIGDHGVRFLPTWAVTADKSDRPIPAAAREDLETLCNPNKTFNLGGILVARRPRRGKTN